MSREAAPREVPPADPTGLDRADYATALRATVGQVKSDDVPSLAAGVAFKIFLSLFPAAIAAVAVFSLVTTPQDLEAVSSAVSDFLPPRAAEVVLAPVEGLVADAGAGAGGLALGGVLAGLWAASSAAVTLVKALSRAYDVEETRKFLGQRLVALAITLGLFLALVAIVLLLVAGGPLQERLVPPQLGLVGAALVTLGRFLGALVALVLLFAFVYWIGPDRERPEWTWMSPGAIVGVVGWLAVSGCFTLYVRLAGSYEATYGALAGVIVLLLWLQLSMMFLLIGAELNAEIERVRDRKAVLAGGPGAALPTPRGPGVGDAPTAREDLAEARQRPPGGPLPGLEEGGALAAGNGRRGTLARAGAAAATTGAAVAVLRHRRRRRAEGAMGGPDR